MGYAIVKTGGKQYRVEEGTIFDVEKLPVEAGTQTTLEEVLLVHDGKQAKVGAPVVAGASVEAEVLEQFKGKKVIAYKFKRRKGYHRTVGHRRQLTRLRVTKIAA